MKCPKKHSALSAKTDFLFWSERDEVRKAVFERDPPLCVWCYRKVGDHRSPLYYDMDHIVLRKDGGPYHPDNLVLSCKECNRERGDSSIVHYMLRRAA